MYSREYNQRPLHFEASGGLVESSLILQDKETNSFWSIMSGQSVAGPMKGTGLKVLPVASKLRWKEWLELHPDTLVLSISGREDLPRNAYADYFESERGFRDATVRDTRLSTKQEVYAFRFRNRSFVVSFQTAAGGFTVSVDGTALFFYRDSAADPLSSTVALMSEQGRFHRTEGGWVHDSGALFDVSSKAFQGAETSDIRRLEGFDTYWYTWAPFHPDTEILDRQHP